MAQFAYQNTLTINRDQVQKGTGKTEPYLTAYRKNLVEAMNELSGTAFKVYVFLLCNANSYKLDFSPAHIAREIGISRDSARSALAEFERKGYLALVKNTSILTGVSYYNFFEERNPSIVKKSAEPKQDGTPEDGRGSYTWE